MADLPASERATLLLVVCFYSLDVQFKSRFDHLLRSRKIDQVLQEMLAQGLFPGWFRDQFTYDPLYGWINELRQRILSAVQDLLIRIDTSSFDYRLDCVDTEELGIFREKIGLDIEYVANLVRQMNQRLQLLAAAA